MGAAHERQHGADPQDCAVCGTPFTHKPRGRKARHCSPACRQKAHRHRHHGDKTRDLVTLVEADAQRFLAGLASESIDLVVTDPPYRFARGTTYFKEWFADLPDDTWPEVLGELHRVLRADRHAYVFCDRRTHPIFTDAAAAAGFRVHDPLIWDKDRIGLGSGPWRSQYELILFLEKGRRAGNRRDLGNVQRARPPARGYPTEKPVALLRTLIAQSSQPGELVLDPFCGSGNVGQAARALGRRALLSDVAATFAARRLRLAPVASEGTAA